MDKVAQQPFQPAQSLQIDDSQQTARSSKSSAAAEKPGDSVGPAPAPRAAAPASAPTESAREAATRKHADFEQMTQERLMSDPEYVKLKSQYDDADAHLMSDFLLVDQFTGICPDKNIQYQDLIALRDDTKANPAAREAALRLLANSEVWQAISKTDNLVGVADVEAFLATQKATLKEMKNAVATEVRAELTAQTSNAATGASGAGGTPGAGGTGATGPLFAASTPSAKSGMEGAVENVNNAIQSIGTSMNSIMAEIANPATTPERRKDLQNQYNELQQLQSMLTAMYTQMQEAISNLMKMYSDVAMNSVRNMK